MTQQRATLPIAVGVDGSEAGLRAARFAALEAAAHHWSVLLVHAYNVRAGLNPMYPWYGMESLRETGEHVLHTADRLVLETSPDVARQTLLVPGGASAALVDASRSAALVVVGRRDLHGVHRVVSGSTSTAVASHSHAPVVSVPGSWSGDPAARAQVVVGVDGSPAGRDALAFAFREASRRSVGLLAVRSWEVPAYWFSDIPVRDAGGAEWSDEARLSLAEDLAGWQEQFPEVTVRTRVEQAHNPADALISHADGAQMLIVGARGAGGLPGMHLGWTAHSVLAHATCPVAVVHHVEDKTSHVRHHEASSHA